MKNTDNQVKLQIIENPKLKISEVDVTYENPQEFGGLKRSVTEKRKALKKFSEQKGYSIKTIAKKYGVSDYSIKRFINKETLKPDMAKKLFKNLYHLDFEAELIKTDISNFQGENKKIVRDLFIKYIKDSGLTKGKFFTLPSSKCLFEDEVNIQLDNEFHYIACEYERKIFNELQQSVVKLNLLMSTIYGEASEEINKANTNDFTHIFYDLCGTFPSYENDVINIIKNDLVVVNGLIGLTFCTREANNKKQSSIDFHSSIIDALNLDVTPSVVEAIKIKLLSFIGNQYEIVEYINYWDNAPMVFALLKRIK